MSSPRSVPCPTCGKRVIWTSTNPSRPFCSERCKAIDLGAWAAESYRIPVMEEKEPPEIEIDQSSI